MPNEEHARLNPPGVFIGVKPLVSPRCPEILLTHYRFVRSARPEPLRISRPHRRVPPAVWSPPPARRSTRVRDKREPLATRPLRGGPASRSNRPPARSGPRTDG